MHKFIIIESKFVLLDSLLFTNCHFETYCKVDDFPTDLIFFSKHVLLVLFCITSSYYCIANWVSHISAFW
jgi:hypothetical protein